MPMMQRLTARIQGFRMRQIRFSYGLIYVRGKDLVTAAILSRVPASNPTSQDIQKESDADSFVNSEIANILISKNFWKKLE